MHSKIDTVAKLISTFFGIGYLPVMPGTFGAAVAACIFLMIGQKGVYSIVFALIVTVAGFVFSGITERILNQKDASCIVIDEVSGMMICLFISPPGFFYAVWAFLLFRIFDVIKPFGIKKLQNFKGSLGIMIDDIAAGILSGVCLQTIVFLKSLAAG